ncbi:hypothetical protein KSB_65640 [Ktedonobacter robiniae]|uniref:ABM domain-containing protein n=2 Tax=Ktedonobacter robiniae TaxID=2778365 RepID=A0ABQ3UZK7_9CHLR|nr:hypothetical protein KSB_65640 [Ktedonobacter robiniae]
MYAVMRKIKVQPHLIDTLTQKTRDVFVPVLKNEPGFIEFIVVQVGEGEAVSISIFETQEAAEEGNRKAFAWAGKHLFPLAEGPAEIVGLGKLLLYQQKEAAGEKSIS